MNEIYYICEVCGMKALKEESNKHCVRFELSTWHNGTCDVCGEEKPVTEIRDFGYPKFKGE